MANSEIPAPSLSPEKDTRILGLSTSELAGVSVDEICGNKTAITMVMHYYRQITDENAGLKNDLNTLKTYVDGYRAAKSDSRTGAILLGISNISIAFGVNLMTGGSTWPGLFTLMPGLVMMAAGLYFSFRDRQ